MFIENIQLSFLENICEVTLHFFRVGTADYEVFLVRALLYINLFFSLF